MDNNILQPISPDFNVFARENASVYFNSTTPPAPDGSTNVTFQFDQFGNVSAYTSGGGGGGGSSVGTAGQIQMVGSTAGSFAASSLTDTGTGLFADEGFTVTGNYQSTVPSSTTVDWYAGTARIVATGPDSSTTGSFEIIAIAGDGTGFSSYFSATPTNVVLGSQFCTVNSLTVNSLLNLAGLTTATSATAGVATALPLTPAGYVEVSINGTAMKLPYYEV